jgi:hypothetical protein
MITYKYRRSTPRYHARTDIYLDGEFVGYYMPLYNKPDFKYMPKGNQNRWWVSINSGDYFLAEKRATKEEIISLVEEYFQKEI